MLMNESLLPLSFLFKILYSKSRNLAKLICFIFSLHVEKIIVGYRHKILHSVDQLETYEKNTAPCFAFNQTHVWYFVNRLGVV